MYPMKRSDARQFFVFFVTPHGERTSEGPRDGLSEEQLSLLVWARWVVRILPYYCAQLRGEQKTGGLRDILQFTAEMSDPTAIMCKYSQQTFLMIVYTFMTILRTVYMDIVRCLGYWSIHEISESKLVSVIRFVKGDTILRCWNHSIDFNFLNVIFVKCRVYPKKWAAFNIIAYSHKAWL
jgi:hypothetical protein